MRYTLFISLLATMTLSTSTFAACNDDETLFRCKTDNNKQIEVCDAKKTIDYSFGKLNKKPELSISVPRDQATTWQWHGVGRYMSYAVNIPNGDYIYRVFWAVDRLSENQEEKAGVHVEKNEKLLATVNCKMDTLTQRLEGVDLPSENE